MVPLLLRIKFLSTLSLRRATHYDNYNLHCVEISIHALLAESDYLGAGKSCDVRDFYPRSPCGERRGFGAGSWRLVIFLSTLSLRRATLRVVDGSKSFIISIHALLAESDLFYVI